VKCCLFVLFFALSCLTASLHADDFTTLAGDHYTNAEIKGVENDGIVIRYSDGVVKLKFNNLPPAIGAKYGYGPSTVKEVLAGMHSNNVVAPQEAVKTNDMEPPSQAIPLQSLRGDQGDAGAPQQDTHAQKLSELILPLGIIGLIIGIILMVTIGKAKSSYVPTSILPTKPISIENIRLKRRLGVTGSALLSVGVFCPIVSLPIVGKMNYFDNGEGGGTIILVFAIATAVLSLVERFPLLWLTGLGSIGQLAITYFEFQSKLSDAKSKLHDLPANPFTGIATLVVRSVQIEWGFAVLVVGALFVLAAAAISQEE